MAPPPLLLDTLVAHMVVVYHMQMRVLGLGTFELPWQPVRESCQSRHSKFKVFGRLCDFATHLFQLVGIYMGNYLHGTVAQIFICNILYNVAMKVLCASVNWKKHLKSAGALLPRGCWPRLHVVARAAFYSRCRVFKWTGIISFKLGVLLAAD